MSEEFENETEEQEIPTCATCSFFKILKEGCSDCMVMQPHYVAYGDTVKKVDGVPVDPDRMGCMHHPQMRGNSTSDQFLKLLQAQLGLAGVEAHGAAQMRSFFMGEE